MVLVIILAGCAATTRPSKPIELPVSTGILAVMHAPVEAPINNAARISVPDETLLIGAKLNGLVVFCTPSPAYYAARDRQRAVCFFDQGHTGYFHGFRIDGIDQPFTLASPVPYSLESSKGLSAAAVAECDDVAFAAGMRDPRLRASARTHCLQDAVRQR